MADPITTGITAAAAAWVWDKFGKDITDKAKDTAKNKWKQFRWRDAAEKYRAKIKKLHGTMQIMGMTEPVTLDDIYVEAYVLDKPTAFSRYDINQLRQLSADPEKQSDAKRKGGLSLVREKGNLFILGKPGAGKTTFLKYIALKAAEELIDKAPIFISLKEWADAKLKLLPFIVSQFDDCDFPEAEPFIEELLKSGHAIVLFDGLDEVNEESGQREEQIKEMKDFVRKYDKTQFLITCRIAASEYTFHTFTYVEMADFTSKQIYRFVINWFRKREDVSKSFLSDFAKDENKNLRELASSPLLLTLLCLSYEATLTFPQRRVEIYEEAIDALLKKWDASRHIRRDEVYKNLSPGHKKQMFAAVAARTFDKNEYFLPQATLEKHLADYLRNVPPHDEADGERVLKAIETQHGIFAERASRIYSFSHLTFQEYFTTRYIVDNASEGTLSELLRHCADNRWREVFLLTTSLLPEKGAKEFLISFREHLNSFIQDDEVLVRIFDWAQRKTNLTQTKTRIIREWYVWIFINGLDRDRDFARARDLDRDRDRDLALALALALALDLDLDLDLVRSLALDLALDLALARSRSHARSLDFDRTRSLDLALDLAKTLGLTELEHELFVLPVPINNGNWLDCRRFATNLHESMVIHRGFEPEIYITNTQAESLIRYFTANRLLKDCLVLATMPPERKEAILENLFLPPERSA